MARILIIEDDAEMRSLLKDFLEEEGFKADSAKSGPEALIKLKQSPRDLIITDIRMPGPSGLEILPKIRILYPEVCIIVITAFGSEEIRRRSLEIGADGYLEKPLHLDELREMVQEMIPNA